MQKTKATLTKNTKLTLNTYELVYTLEDSMTEAAIAGQYVMFQLAKGLNRAYSFTDVGEKGFVLIVERIPEGKGSPLLCDAKVGDIFDVLLPLGHFQLQNTQKSKCFIGTGTGFAPLYCMIKNQMQNFADTKMIFHFGVRTLADTFYTSEIEIFQKNPHFTFVPYLSRAEADGYEHGYVTQWIQKENVALFEEFYICGSPEMVKDAREKLSALGIEKEQIFWEQY